MLDKKIKSTANEFNLYAKKNPIGYEFENQMSGQIKVYQHTLFTIVPNFSIKAEL